MKPVVFGAAYSVYVRAVRLALEEKGVAYRCQDVDVFAPGGPPAEHRRRHPFGRIPAFEHDGFRLYESGAITRYVDEAFPGPALQPTDAKARARMNQAISVLDGYVYPTLVWAIYVERADAARDGRPADEEKIAQVLPRAELCLSALSEIMGPAPWLVGSAPTLADLHAAPMFAYFAMTPEGAALFDRYPVVARWWAAMKARPCMAATRQARARD